MSNLLVIPFKLNRNRKILQDEKLNNILVQLIETGVIYIGNVIITPKLEGHEFPLVFFPANDRETINISFRNMKMKRRQGEVICFPERLYKLVSKELKEDVDYVKTFNDMA